MTRPTGSHSPPGDGAPPVLWLKSLVLVGVGLGLGIPAVLGLIRLANVALTRLGSPEGAGLWPPLGVCFVVGVAAVGISLRLPSRVPEAAFVVAVSAAALVVRVVYVKKVTVDPVSDFHAMWSLAERVLSEGFAGSLQDATYTTRIHLERILPVLLPLRAVFGPDRLAYALPNAVMTVACSLAAYSLARGMVGPAGARCALVLSLLAVEPIVASGLPTHDIPGAAFTLVALALLLRIYRLLAAGAGAATPRTAALSVATGVVLSILELQRSSRVVLIPALVVLLLGLWLAENPVAKEMLTRRGLRRLLLGLLLLVVGPLAVSSLIERGLEQGGLRMDQETRRFWLDRAMAGHTDSWSPASREYAVEEYYEPFELTGQGWHDLAWRKWLTDSYHNPLDRLSYCVRKATGLLSVGAQMYFYLGPSPTWTGDKQLGARAQLFVRVANGLFAALFLLLMSIGLASVGFSLDPRLERLVPAVLLATLATVLILFFQVQPRYMFPIWYLGAIYAGEGARRLVDAAIGEPR